MTRRNRKFKTLSVNEILPKIVTPLLKSHGVKGGLLYDWKKIVGENLAQLTRPEKIIYKKGSVGGGVLHLAIAPSIALELQHTQQQLIDKINTYFGYKSVGSIKIRQCHFQISTKPEKQLCKKQKLKIEEQVSDIMDQELSNALQSLGEVMSLKE